MIVLALIVLLAFVAAGYLRLHWVSGLAIGALCCWLAIAVYRSLAGDAASQQQGANYLPYLLAALILTIALAHLAGWGVSRIRSYYAARRSNLNIGETFQ